MICSFFIIITIIISFILSIIMDRNSRRDTPKASDELLDFFLLTIARKKKRVNLAVAQERENSSSSANNEDSDGVSSDSDDCSLEDPLEPTQAEFRILNGRPYQIKASSSSSHNNDEEASSSKQKVEVVTNSSVIVHREDLDETEEEGQTGVKVNYDMTVEPMAVEEVVVEEKNTENSQGKQKNRDKFDSGLGDELLISELPVDMVETVSSSSDEDRESKRSNGGPKEKRFTSKWRKIERVDAPKKCDSGDSSDYEDKSDSESENVEAMGRMKMYISPYTVHMKRKIQQLPLPSNVKKFLNFYRDF